MKITENEYFLFSVTSDLLYNHLYILFLLLIIILFSLFPENITLKPL